jgi:hypothetical protein
MWWWTQYDSLSFSGSVEGSCGQQFTIAGQTYQTCYMLACQLDPYECECESQGTKYRCTTSTQTCDCR